MTRWILSLGALACLAFVGACNGELSEVGSDGSDAGTTWGEGVPGADASVDTPFPPDAAVDYDGGTIEDASPGDDATAYTDASCPPPPPPPPPCGCPVADASVPEDAEAPVPDPGP